MAKQNRLLRTICKGNFRDFVKAINKDPAMMEFLDTVRNRKEQPERELRARAAWSCSRSASRIRAGDPNYDQDDIVQIARAFTGWDYDGTRSSSNEGDHDQGDAEEDWDPARGPKVIFKNRGGFGDPAGQSFDIGRRRRAPRSTAVIDIIFQHRDGATGSERSTVADYIAQRLITYFAHPDPDADLRPRRRRRLGLRDDVGHRRAAARDLRPRRLLPERRRRPPPARRSR